MSLVSKSMEALKGGSPIEERIVIVGGGIGGLSCALALHRVGLKAVVLEQAPTSRAEGTSITLSTNAFRVMDTLGIGDQIRKESISIEGQRWFDNNGNQLNHVRMADCPDGPHEVRGVERRVLLDALTEQLPSGTIRFNSRVERITKVEGENGVTHLELQDGTVFSSKIVVGVDGANSVVAKWMGLPKPESVGQVGVRGIAFFPDGHNIKPEVHYYLGKGVRSLVIPITTTKAYWLVAWNDWSSDSLKDPTLVKEEVLKHIRGWSSSCATISCIEKTPTENMFSGSLKHRINSHETSLQVRDGVTLAGDASHPSTPNLAQGACCALEDAIVLAQKLFGAMCTTADMKTQISNGDKSVNHLVVDDDEKLRQRINTAFLEFQAERHARTHPLTVQAYRIGTLSQSNWSLVCFLRNWFLIPNLNRKTMFLHTLFDVGKLPQVDGKPT